MVTAAARWGDGQADKELAVMLGMITACRRTGMIPGPRLSRVLPEWHAHRGPNAAVRRPLSAGSYYAPSPLSVAWDMRRAMEQGYV